ncbi:MAG: efflux RND transporter periplasmic adaptor subunit [Thermodesulfobacteriota bacterium]
MKFRSVLTVICLTLLCLPPAADSSAQKKQGSKPVVGARKVILEDANSPEKYIGHVEAVESIDLKARVDGYLEQVDFAEGSQVEKGQILYVIEQAPYQARVAAAKAGVAQAEAELFKARTKLERLRSAGAGSIPQTDMDDAKAAYELAQARVLEARADLQLAQIDLDYTTIKAPMDGRIGKSFFKTGDLISPSSGSMAEVVSVDPTRVVFSVSERHSDVIKQAGEDAANPEKAKLQVRISGTGGNEYSHTGRIEFVDNRMDTSTGTIAMWAHFPNPEGHLVDGEYVNVYLKPAEPHMQASIPQTALQRDKDGEFVFVADDDSRIEKRRIETGRRSGERIFVTTGLKEGELVVCEGIQKVTPDTEAEVRLQEDKDQ